MTTMEMLQYLFFKQTCNLRSVAMGDVTLVTVPCDVQVGPAAIVLGFYLAGLALFVVLSSVEVRVARYRARWLR